MWPDLALFHDLPTSALTYNFTWGGGVEWVEKSKQINFLNNYFIYTYCGSDTEQSELQI